MSGWDDLIGEAEQVKAGLQTQSQPMPARTLAPPEPLSFWDKALSSVPTDLVNNPAVAGARTFVTAAAAPVMGTAQLFANMFPDSTGVPQKYNAKIAEVLRKDKAAQTEEGPVGAAANEFAGSMVSPVNLIGAGAKPAITTTQRALQGAGLGAVAGASSPVEVSPSGKFWGQKAAQTGLGVVTGGITAPVIGAVGDRVLAKINQRGFDPTQAAQQADEIINGALKDSNQSIVDLPPDRLNALRAQVVDALSNGKQLDAAAALRLRDFTDEGITPLQGWITRDPMQWAAEQNVRGVKGAGEPVSNAIVAGNQALTQKIGQYGSSAQEPYIASQDLASALRKYGEGQRANVTAEYTVARQSAGKDLQLPVDGLVNTYREVLDSFGDKVPTAVQAKFQALMPREPLPGTAAPAIFGTIDRAAASQPGPPILNTLESVASELQPHGYGAPLSSAEYSAALPQNIAQPGPSFTFEDADKLRKVINDNVDKSAPGSPTNTALTRLRRALDATQYSVDAAGGPYAPAVSAARKFHQQQEAVPALSDAMGGAVDDRFVKQAVVNNPSTPEVQRLAALLREQAPDQYQAVRQQIGAHLSNAAFGANAAGDATVAQASYNKALNNLGTGKLEAFFAPQEIEQMKRLGRIAAYQVAPPAAAASNYSNTASTAANLLRLIGGYVPVAGKAVQFGGDKLEAWSAMRPNVPVTPNLTDEQRQMLSRALLAFSGGAALTVPRVVGQ